MRHIHTSSVSRHLVTRGNNKIMRNLHHTLAALKRHFPASLVVPLPNSEQISHPSSSHIYTKSTPNHINHHYAPSVTLTHTSFLQLHPHTHHIVTPGFVDRPRWSYCTAGQMDGEAGWWMTSGNIELPPLARVMGVGRQQQQQQRNNFGAARKFSVDESNIRRRRKYTA